MKAVIGITTFVITILSLLCLFYDWNWHIASTFIVIVNVYQFFLLVFAAHISDGGELFMGLEELFPSRTLGLFLFIMFLIIISSSFARLYFSFSTEFLQKHTHFEALYASFGILSTVSIGELKPVSERLKWDIIFEVLSTVNLLFAAFPLLLSRFNLEHLRKK